MYRPSFWTRLRSYFWPVTIEKRKGQLNHDLEVLVYHGKTMLDTEYVNYSFGKLHDVMKGVLLKLKKRNYPFEQVLILGYGGGSAAQIIHEEINPDAQIVGVELDTEIVDLSEKYFYKRDVKILNEDAFLYVQRAVNQEWEYDTIIVDVFENQYQPNWDDAFWLNVKMLLNPNGVGILNTMLDDQQFRKIGEELQTFGFIVQEWNEIRENKVWVFRK